MKKGLKAATGWRPGYAYTLMLKDDADELGLKGNDRYKRKRFRGYIKGELAILQDKNKWSGPTWSLVCYPSGWLIGDQKTMKRCKELAALLAKRFDLKALDRYAKNEVLTKKDDKAISTIPRVVRKFGV